MFEISDNVRTLCAAAESELRGIFSNIEKTAEHCTEKVMAAFRRHSVSEAMFAGSTGYGYDDMGRAALERIYADVFGCESALVRIGFVNGTHAISSALFGALTPGQKLVSAVGAPYDTLRGVIGITGNYHGSLKMYGIGYAEAEPDGEGNPDIPEILRLCEDKSVGAVLIQRSRGYSSRKSLSTAAILEICRAVREVNDKITIIADNCYGEFTEPDEPGGAGGADIICGSLIKNPGGGLALTGGYVTGRTDMVERAAYRMTVPGIGGECGSTLGQNRSMFQGLFMAPHTVAQSLKTAALCAKMMKEIGFETNPEWNEKRSDIIQMINFGDRVSVEAFCGAIQQASPVDSFVTPEAWPMPGYGCDVIMAAGTFVQGASIELSCDAPMREPYSAYLQGGLTYESGKIGIMYAVGKILEKREKR
ncbi:MAG: methionine gamma-lyase family protein [Oscillospiraceae bacterium]|jgi:cystathionine beta-lyase family protein involved in aluminum resistance|nr:methionine gamma-lyase family protein [Oscillospiraceae bacterium]